MPKIKLKMLTRKFRDCSLTHSNRNKFKMEQVAEQLRQNAVILERITQRLDTIEADHNQATVRITQRLDAIEADHNQATERIAQRLNTIETHHNQTTQLTILALANLTGRIGNPQWQPPNAAPRENDVGGAGGHD